MKMKTWKETKGRGKKPSRQDCLRHMSLTQAIIMESAVGKDRAWQLDGGRATAMVAMEQQQVITEAPVDLEEDDSVVDEEHGMDSAMMMTLADR
jgi:hypothetical protein